MAAQIAYVSAFEAIQLVKSGDRVYVGSNCGQPQTLTQALYDDRERLENVDIVHLLVSGDTPYVNPECSGHLHHTAFFLSGNTRPGFTIGTADYLPIFLSDVPKLFRSGKMPIDVALVSVTEPDDDGYVSLGIAVDLAWSALEVAKIAIAEVQPEMPRTFGQNRIHVSRFDALVRSERPILERHSEPGDEVSHAIAKHVAALVEDGSCLQIGIGRIPDAVLEALKDKNDLGVHSELIGDGVIDLWQNGNITGARKSVFPGKTVATFSLGTKKLYRAVHENPHFEFHPTEAVNDPFVIGQIDNVVAINGALQVDLSGQVVSDSIGPKIYSGYGGQVDFIRGAARSRGGKPVIVLPSMACNGSVSRIVSTLTPGAGVVTSRADVHWVVTEYGAVDLHGMPLRSRAEALIQLAHPTVRDRLRVEATETGWLR